MTDTENPLLHPTTPPRFDLITPEHVVPAVRALLADLGAELDRLEASAAPTWDAVVEPITSMTDRLSLVWGTVGHLMGVRNSDALRTAHETVQPEVVAFSIRLGQSKPIYRALKGLESGEAWAALDDTQRRIVASLVRDAELSGVGLEGAAQARFSAIQTELAEVSTRFSNNVLDATKAFALELRRARGGRGAAAQPARARRAGGAAGGRRDRDRRRRPVADHARCAELRALHAARPPARSARAALPRVRHAREQRRARQHAAARNASCACGASRPRCSASPATPR